jgi:hypothetical protein
MNFIVKARIANLPPEVVKQIFEDAVSYYIEEHIVEVHPEFKALTDDESTDWQFQMDLLEGP